MKTVVQRGSFLMGLVLLTTACMVSEELTFEDSRNVPPQFLLSQPSNDVLHFIVNDSTVAFTVFLWEPDAEDFAFYDSRISLIEPIRSGIQIVDTFFCEAPVRREMESFTDGVVLSITCPMTIRTTQSTTRNVFVRFESSDRGYVAGNVTPPDARTLQVMWIYEILPQQLL